MHHTVINVNRSINSSLFHFTDQLFSSIHISRLAVSMYNVAIYDSI
uniref:Uncharacterized protein n=1 Tax=Arundo donax TaxID=35708 RepID=A0A0A9GFE2_ARUDO